MIDINRRPEDFGGTAVFAEKGLAPERDALTQRIGWFVISMYDAKPGETWMRSSLRNGSLQFTCFPDRVSAEAFWESQCFSDFLYAIHEITEDYVREALLARGHQIG